MPKGNEAYESDRRGLPPLAESRAIDHQSPAFVHCSPSFEPGSESPGFGPA